MILFEPSTSQHPFRFAVVFFPVTSLTPSSYTAATLTYCHAVCFHVCRIPPTSGLEGEHCGGSESSVVQLSSLQESVAKSIQVCGDNDPTPPHPQQLRLPVAS